MPQTFENIALHVPRICLPREDIDLAKWAVIACDQYTSQPEYWQKVDETAGNAPSTLKLILPEAYLETEQEEAIVNSINKTMSEYLAGNILQEHAPGFVLVDRKTPHQASRKGLVVALDLEQYDYNQGSTTLIRATEGTIIERLPPRIRVRQDAPLELPHIMVLIDDPDRTVIEPLFEQNLEPLYDFDLMQNAGHVTGYMVDNDKHIQQVADALTRLADPECFNTRYGTHDKPALLYAMGDGNHSLATAKAIWEKRKQQAGTGADIMNHPSRFALVELVNIHDTGLEFEPIHRALFGVETEALFQHMKTFLAAQDALLKIEVFSTLEEFRDAQKQDIAGCHRIPFICHNAWGMLTVETPARNLVVATLQEPLDDFIAKHPDIEIDYIHGKDVVEELGSKPGNIGFLLPAIDKHNFFKSIILDGALPRKTFSMGEADEKRFYLECRRIR